MAIMVNEVEEVVFVNDFLWDDVDWDAHVFEALHGSSKVEVLEIDATVAGTWGGDGAIDA